MKKRAPGTTQKVYVELSSDLHGRAKAAGTARGNMSVPEVYTEALTHWLEWIEGSVKTPLGDLHQDDLKLLGAVAEYLRAGPERIPVRDFLERLVRLNRRQ